MKVKNYKKFAVTQFANKVTATNLAYVRYFGNIDNATKATFKSLDSRSFTLDYELPDDTKVHQAVIFFKTPLQKREEIRVVLEAMAKEAEEALGLVRLYFFKYASLRTYL